jgi:hypothetical protein
LSQFIIFHVPSTGLSSIQSSTQFSTEINDPDRPEKYNLYEGQVNNLNKHLAMDVLNTEANQNFLADHLNEFLNLFAN